MNKSTDLGTKIRSGAAWLFAGNTTSQAIKFLAGIVLARLLVPDDFGMLLTIQVFTGLAAFVAAGGMGQALVRAKEVNIKDYHIVFSMQFTICCAIYAGFFFSAPWLADWYNTPVYTDLLRISALSFIVRPFVSLPNNILAREMRFKEQSRARVLALLTSGTVSIAMASAGYGVWSLIFGGVTSSVTTALLLIPLTDWRPRFSFDFRRGKNLARYGFLVSVTDIIFYLQTQISIFILSHTLGPGSVGLYNKGDNLARMPHSFVTGSVYQVLFRSLAAEHENLDKCRYLFFRSITLVAVYTTPFYVGLAWLSEPLVRGLYGSNWTPAAAPLLVLSCAWPFWLANNLSGAVLAAKNLLEKEILAQIITLLIMCIAVTAGLNYGLKGVAVGVLSAIAYSAIHMYVLASGSLKARRSTIFRALLPAIILNLILSAVLFVVDYSLPTELRSGDLKYVMSMSLSGGVVYTLCFLYLPIPSLQSERNRWKVKLRLANKSTP